jgi:diguanylate cyclase (GGDEF)-like protein
VARPRNIVERAFGLALFILMLTSVLRLGFTLSYQGGPRVDLIYMPVLPASLLAVQYAVMPILAAALLLGLVNARLQQRLRLRASTDELTGVLTRRALRELAPRLIDEARHAGREVAVLILDLDHFKAVNDRLGHATGDRVLAATATVLRDHLRPDSLLARFGGEEFVALIPTDDLPGARRASERLRGSVESVDWGSHGLDWRMTVSIGVALVGPNETLDATLTRADEALYRSKRDGRNQVQVSLVAA